MGLKGHLVTWLLCTVLIPSYSSQTELEEPGPTTVESDYDGNGNETEPFINSTVVEHVYNALLGIVPENWTAPGETWFKEPSSWGGSCQMGKAQSPIDLVTSAATQRPSSDRPVRLEGGDYDKRFTTVLFSNNGHSVVLQTAKGGDSRGIITHVDKKTKYTFSQLHFHWGLTPETGSEHTLNGESFPMEVHLVHYKSKYGSLKAALDAQDSSALAVLGTFIKAGKTNPNFETIVDAARDKAMSDTGFFAMKGSFYLRSMLPTKGSAFRYQGSLTTPTCDEKVLWYVFDTPVELSEDQIQVFRDVRFSYENHMSASNFRTVQPLNGRKVEYFA